ncbi:MinD/ParA family ATP-binding protein [Halobacterium litoreum]|uniref:MinD/ParA family protein n=1 Tax=Halobacterium litoreum TaxID=2039234 RepID=A0ABD5NCC3_9EURY|nr:AAA family ATPase [Halobacterium litoreum]UHH14488.1 AAA family ATPase [Halobacterium litoreum]
MLAVAGGKGGSGKTTTALGVASALAERRRRPLVVDCDLDAPNLHLRADVPRDPGVGTVSDAGIDAAGDPAALAHESPAVPGVDVLPAGDADGDALAAAIASLSDDRPVVLDCPAGASEAAARPLRAADGCLVVATRGRESVEDAVKTAAMARAVGTPVRAVAVSREPAVPRGLGDALDAPRVVPVPAADAPLRAATARSAYRALADAARPNS